MKKIVTICLLVFGFLFTTQTVNAQQKFDTEINQKAQTKAVEFGRFLKADKATQDVIYTAYQEYLSKINSINNTLKPGTSNYIEVERKITKRLLSQMNEVLSTEQYAQYIELTDFGDVTDE